MTRNVFSAALLAALCLTGTSRAVDIIWDGGDGEWNDFIGLWNGGQEAINVFNRTDGWEFNSAPVGNDVFINSGNVTYDPNIFDDFRFNSNGPGNGGTLTIGQGASLSMYTDFDRGGDQDGNWTQFNADTLNLDGGVFRRGFVEPAVPPTNELGVSGGIFSFNGIRGYANADIKINLTNGGGIENDGQLTFGWYLQDEDAVGTKVTMTINDGYLDLTGAAGFDHLEDAAGGGGNADLHFQYGWDPISDAPADPTYIINFIGPGTITVDEGGILVVEQTGPGEGDFDFDTILNQRSYEDLWNLGILQANGQSGVDGATFGDFFTVENAPGDVDYKLTWLDFVPGDFNKDGAVDGNDFLLWQANFPLAEGATQIQGDADGNGTVDGNDFLIWQAAFGSEAGGGAASVPEPGTLMLVALLVSLGIVSRRPTR